MAKPVLPDDLWQLIEPLLPPPKPRRVRYPGRRPLDRRKVLTGVLFVLKSGIPWEMLPKELGCGSGMTCWRYLEKLHKQGVWQKVHEVLLAGLRGVDAIDWSRAVVDSASVRAVLGGRKRAPIPRIAARRAANTMSSPTPRGCRLRAFSPQPT